MCASPLQWTSWALLVMLALYDLCAVLTPCGPLRALINLAQTRRDPIPGLLYEANVGGGNSEDRVHDSFVTDRGAVGGQGGQPGQQQRPGAVVAAAGGGAPGGAAVQQRMPSPTNPERGVSLRPMTSAGIVVGGGSDAPSGPGPIGSSISPPARMPSHGPAGLGAGGAAGTSAAKTGRAMTAGATPLYIGIEAPSLADPTSGSSSIVAGGSGEVGSPDAAVPLAAAAGGSGSPSAGGVAAGAAGGGVASPPAVLQVSLVSESSLAAAGAPSELMRHHHTHTHSHASASSASSAAATAAAHGGAAVVVKNPASPRNASPGGAAAGGTVGPTYAQLPARPGAPGAAGGAGARDMEVAGEAPLEPEEEDAERSIKLGLGDFVFYSVLVSRAALYDMATMAACFVSVIMGLAGTLFLLGVFKKALPALPISIFFGVAFYFLTRLVVVPMITELSLNAVGV